MCSVSEANSSNGHKFVKKRAKNGQFVANNLLDNYHDAQLVCVSSVPCCVCGKLTSTTSTNTKMYIAHMASELYPITYSPPIHFARHRVNPASGDLPDPLAQLGPDHGAAPAISPAALEASLKWTGNSLQEGEASGASAGTRKGQVQWSETTTNTRNLQKIS